MVKKLDKNLSTVAKIGKVLTILGIIFNTIGIFAIFFISLMGFFGGMGLFLLIIIPVGILKLVGILLASYGYEDIKKYDIDKASKRILIASFLPPLDILFLIAAILLMVSKESS